MQFDLIIGNPPYQTSYSCGHGPRKNPLYHLFIEQAKQINPSYICMVVPARWYAGSRMLNKFLDEMINDKQISHLVDYKDSSEVFQGVAIGGGICYFIWDKNKTDANCKITLKQKGFDDVVSIRPLKIEGIKFFIKHPIAIKILEKVKPEVGLDSIITSGDFGHSTKYRGEPNKSKDHNIKLYRTRGVDYISEKEVLKNHHLIPKYKVYVPEAGRKPFIGEPNTVATHTYITIDTYDDYKTAYNMCTYISTKFFQFMVSLIANTHNAYMRCYQFVPIVNLDKPRTDSELYEMFKLDEKEIATIESTIEPMETKFKNPYEDK